MRLKPLWMTASLLVGAHAAHASLTDYLAARTKFSPRPGVTIAALENDPATYANVVIEVKGTVAGVSRSGDESNLLLRTATGDTVVLHGSNGADLPDMGAAARALVSVAATGQMNLLSAVSENEIGDHVIDAPKSPRKPPASRFGKATPTPYLSRSNVGSRGAFNISAYIPYYKDAVLKINSRLSDAAANKIANAVVSMSAAYGVDGRLIMAILATESGFKMGARSRTGAMGLGQLMPGTARSLGVRNAWDVEENIAGAAKLLRKHLDAYRGDPTNILALVCAAYNAGPGAVKKYGGVPPYHETQQYVQKVTAWYRLFTSGDH